jgi:RNA polymerase sigma-70 factor (ECF subfamily)
MISKRRRIYYEDIQFAQNLIAEEISAEELKIRERKEQLEMELQDYLDHLPVMDKQLLELKYFKKYSVKELQEEFNLSASAVKMRLLRARQKVEQLVDFSFAA